MPLGGAVAPYPISTPSSKPRPKSGEVHLDLCKQREENAMPTSFSFPLDFGTPGPVAEKGMGPPGIFLVNFPHWKSRMWPKPSPWAMLSAFMCFISQHAGLQDRWELRNY